MNDMSVVGVHRCSFIIKWLLLSYIEAARSQIITSDFVFFSRKTVDNEDWDLAGNAYDPVL